jgi:glycine betaine/proline transport system substrate-binding protein
MERRRFLQVVTGAAAGAVAANAVGAHVFAAAGGSAVRPARRRTGGIAGVGTETIVLAQNPWTASALNAEIAKRIIEENLGNPVEIVALDENTMWSGLASGDLDACLELWPSGIAEDEQKYLDDGDVVVVGELGVVGRIGWYVPRYVVDEHPELATWEGFADPELAKLFATAETGDLGRFLGTDPSYSQADETIISNLGLPLQVIYSGSEPATFAAVESAVSAEEPILLYWWVPTAAAAHFDLVQVELPPYDADNWANPDDIATAYPEDVLMKIAGAHLGDKDPVVSAFLGRFLLTNDDQLAMLPAVEIDGEDAVDVAAAWVDDNEAVWSAWLSDDAPPST